MVTPNIMEQPLSVTLSYSIARCSEHSGRYVAENIMVDRPLDQASRWSGAHQNSKSRPWIMLRLDSTSVIKSITFGKYFKKHPCNMKDFILYVGMTPENMMEVLHSSLRDDQVPETFSVKHMNRDGVCFPTRFVKIVPVSAHMQSFHISIWYVSLTGITNEEYVKRVQTGYTQYRELSAMRHVLKHLRQRRHTALCRSLIAQSGVQLEHPIVTEIYDNLVLHGDWALVERNLHAAAEAGLFNAFIYSCQPHAVWKRLHGVDADGDAPSRRGGHAMCIDHDHGQIYLFGGWDGRKSLDDFWRYDIAQDKWRVLSHSTASERNGPSPRSCHKMVFDTKTGSIFLLGRLSDDDGRSASPGDDLSSSAGNSPTASASSLRSEFFRYHTRGMYAGNWDLLAPDTAVFGGPSLIYDHQMVMDCEAQIIYVFGGKVFDEDRSSTKYSGLFRYNARNSTWKALQANYSSSLPHAVIPPRDGHSMILEPNTRTLYIYAGQRDDKYLSDMYAYDIATDTVTELFSNFTASGGPDASFTQRVVIDPSLRELYVFSGLTKNRMDSSNIVPPVSRNWLYRYEKLPGQWIKILPEDADEDTALDGESGRHRPLEEPTPRYAHQVVYDEKTKTVFMHGGNGGQASLSTVIHEESEEDEGQRGRYRHGELDTRLDDFWSMTLNRPTPDEIIRKMVYRIRRQQFREMCDDGPPVKALNFLQTLVSSVVNYKSREEISIFRSLLSHLLVSPSPTQQPEPPKGGRTTEELNDDTASQVNQQSTASDKDWDMSDSPGANPNIGTGIAYPAFSLNTDREEDGSTLSAVRFSQRTEVFEDLLKFISPDAQQPSSNIIDMIDRFEEDVY